MKKINNKVLVIPPYISTDWSHVQALFVRDDILYVALKNGERIAVPNLTREEIENIFSSHSVYLEEAGDSSLSEQEPKIPPLFGSGGQQNPFRISFGAMDNLGNIMQHNPEMANAPELPSEIADKIASIAKIIAPEELSALPKAEPHCNCVHCQIVRAMNPEQQAERNIVEVNEETVTEDDLQFCQWDIISESDKIYTVINRIDSEEKYKVCLDPLGCTCGREGCEHIVAVLKS